MKPAHRIHFLKTAWFRYAATVVFVVGLGSVAYSGQPTKKPIRRLQMVTIN